MILVFTGAGTLLGLLVVDSPLIKLHPDLQELLRTGAANRRLHMGPAEGFFRVLVLLDSSGGTESVRGAIQSPYTIMTMAKRPVVLGSTNRAGLSELAANPSVRFVLPDVRLDFERLRPDPDLGFDEPVTNMMRVREIMQADIANRLGIKGRDVVIAFADGGADFGIADLRNAVARDARGFPLLLDADGQGFVYTDLVVEKFAGFLKTAGKKVRVWNGHASDVIDTSTPFPATTEHVFTNDIFAPNVFSKSGKYHVGILREYIQDQNLNRFVVLNVTVVVTDPQTAGVYDTLFLDLSTAYYQFTKFYGPLLNAGLKDLELPFQVPSPNILWNDNSTADEEAYRLGFGTDILARDFTGDGVADFSVGALSYLVDIDGVMGVPFAVLPPIDPNGNFINVFFDFDGHGTFTASSAVSRGIVQRDLYRNASRYSLSGVAPEASVMGLKVLWLGDTLFAFYWAAGFDWDSTATEFRYTGQHKADIVSNSWSISNWVRNLGAGPSFDYEGMFEQAFAIPGYLDPQYPGTVIVQAGGNGGFGYGTTAAPSTGTLLITVGASTSYHFRRKFFNDQPSGGHDEIVSWSARGPNAVGEVKPDVVSIGANAFDDTMTYYGYGDGRNAFDIFAGTSLSTPLTAGVAALVIEAYRKTHEGQTPGPDIVKSILMSSASDLGYDPFAQGSGRVNALSAVSAASEGKNPSFAKGTYVSSPATWTNLAPLISQAWSIEWQSSLPRTAQLAPKWHAGIVRSGTSATAEFSFRGAPVDLPLKASVYTYRLIKEMKLRGSSEERGSPTWLDFPLSNFPKETALVRFNLRIPFSDFANLNSLTIRNLLTFSVYDTRYDPRNPSFIELLSGSTGRSSVQEVQIAKPFEKFQGLPRLRVFTAAGSQGIPFTVHVTFYEKASWNWVSVSNPSQNGFASKLSVPSDAKPGVYQGAIAVESGNKQLSIVPISVVVPIVESGVYGGIRSGETYENFALSGAFRWDWRYESGDWRVFALQVPKTVTKISVMVTWRDELTDVDMHVLGRDGYLKWSSEYPQSFYVGSGKFQRHTNTGKAAELAELKVISGTNYFILLHNVLLGGSSDDVFPEAFTITVAFG